MQGKRKSVEVSARQFTGFGVPTPSGVNCQTIMASGIVFSSARHAGERTVFGPTWLNSSPRTQAWLRACPTVQRYVPIVAQQVGQKRGRLREQCLDRSRGGFSSKIHLLVNALGFPLQFILNGGERYDISQVESLLVHLHFDAFIADRGYDSDSRRELLTTKQVEAVIPSRRYRKQPRHYDRIRYRERNIVERFINRVKWYRWHRRIFTRYEKPA